MATTSRRIRLDLFCETLAQVLGREDKFSDAMHSKMTELIALSQSRPDAIEILDDIRTKQLGLDAAIRELRRPRALAIDNTHP
jgi:hypothetical protein